MSIARAAVRELLISEARLVLELKTARAVLSLADCSLVIHEDHPLVDTAIGAGTGAWLSTSFDLLCFSVQDSWFLFP